MADPPARAEPQEKRRVGELWHQVWLKRATWALALIGLAIGTYFLAAAFLPRWWAHRVGAQVSGSIAAGVALGLFYGFVFTFLPLFVLWRGFRRRRPWKHWLAFVVGAVLLASPNLLTLGIVIGTGNAAHAGERTLDVEAPAYRTSVLIGSIVALALYAMLFYLLFSRRLARGRVQTLREKLKIGEADRKRELEQDQSSSSA
jgi:sterol desaturase/sphingolipid hydroxylase (fatty acid hydroxylase superfamily)